MFVMGVGTVGLGVVLMIAHVDLQARVLPAQAGDVAGRRPADPVRGRAGRAGLAHRSPEVNERGGAGHVARAAPFLSRPADSTGSQPLEG